MRTNSKRGWIVYRHEQVTYVPQLPTLLRRLWRLKCRIAPLHKLISDLQHEIQSHLRAVGLAGSRTFNTEIGDGILAKIRFQDEYEIVDVEGLRQFLGDKFDELVDKVTQYKPTPQLVAMVEREPGLQKFIHLKPRSPSIEFIRR